MSEQVSESAEIWIRDVYVKVEHPISCAFNHDYGRPCTIGPEIEWISQYVQDCAPGHRSTVSAEFLETPCQTHARWFPIPRSQSICDDLSVMQTRSKTIESEVLFRTYEAWLSRRPVMHLWKISVIRGHWKLRFMAGESHFYSSRIGHAEGRVRTASTWDHSLHSRRGPTGQPNGAQGKMVMDIDCGSVWLQDGQWCEESQAHAGPSTPEPQICENAPWTAIGQPFVITVKWITGDGDPSSKIGTRVNLLQQYALTDHHSNGDAGLRMISSWLFSRESQFAFMKPSLTMNHYQNGTIHDPSKYNWRHVMQNVNENRKHTR
jgi:hypothetical protein